MLDVEHRLVDVANTVSQQIDGHHGQGMLATLQHVVGIVVLYTKILAETQRLSLKPCLLQLNQNELLRPVVESYAGTEVYAQHRNGVALVVNILMGTYLHLYGVFFQQCRQDGTRNALILHQVLEHHVVDRVGNSYHKLR